MLVVPLKENVGILRVLPLENIKTLVLVVLMLMTIIYNSEILQLSNPEVQWLTPPL